MPIQRTSAVPTQIREAISYASRHTGASFDYLVNTARRESSFKANAKSPTSSAAGLFQFVEGTWLKMVKDEGPRLGLSQHAKYIHKTSGGHYYVPNARARRKILALRHDAETAALVAGAYTEHNARYVASRIGREPSEGELYLAHFFGPGNAAKMIELADSRPDAPASRYFPRAARANRSIFYDHGRSRSLSQVREILVSSHLETDSSGHVQRSQYGPLDFGAMGSLMADIQRSEHHYGKGESGSIGVWGDWSGDQHQVVDSKPARSAGSRTKTASNETRHSHSSSQHAEQHRRAAHQYRTAAEASHGVSTSGENWLKNMFGN